MSENKSENLLDVTEEVTNSFNDLKLKRKHKWLIFRINERDAKTYELVVSNKGRKHMPNRSTTLQLIGENLP